MKKKVFIIGSGFSSLSAACYLAKYGFDVSIFEKNDSFGGRARQFKTNGYTFDMGPSWYWMPDLFESFFSDFDRKASDYYNLTRLDPGYRVYFEDKEFFDVPESYEKLKKNLEKIESGSSDALDKFLSDGKIKYEIAVKKFIYKPSLSPFEYIRLDLIKHLGRLAIFKPISKHIREFFTDKRIIQMLEFAGLLLGAKPSKTPALYSLMNFADIKLGTWYPEGGMHKIVEAMVSLAKEKGVKFYLNEEVKSLGYIKNSISYVIPEKKTFDADYVVCSADYHHFDQNILKDKFKNYSKSYWDKRILAPSSLLFYIGLDKKLRNVKHHCLFFDKDFENHAEEIYTTPRWPSEPLFYASFTSKSDKSVAPKGCENMFLLMPVAPDLEDNKIIRDRYFELILSRLEKITKQNIRDHIIYKKSYAINEFKKDYNSFKGNAYGLANTLFQTAIFKPSLKNKKLTNLYFSGQLTVPGPGVPPSIISGNVVASEILKKV